MKYIKKFILICIALFTIISSCNFNVLAATKNSTSLNLTEDEINWINNNEDRIFALGMFNILGSESFEFNNQTNGFMNPLIKKINEDLGINIKIDLSKSWSEVYLKFQNNNIDILYGINETSERDKFMLFTTPILKMPYAIISKKDGSVRTIGDIDKKKVGFIENDYVIEELPRLYKNIKYEKKLYFSNDEEINALRNNEIDAFITVAGPFIYDFLYKYPELSYAFKINTITCDMTFSTKKENNMLMEILNKEITNLQQGKELFEIIDKAQVDYNLKIMNLTDEEKKWLLEDGTAIIGIAKDYLPIDYYDNGEFKGIEGNIINEVSKMTGIKFKYDYDSFDVLEQKLYRGEIDVLNVAKTEERMKKIIYNEPFFKERDIIVGRKEEKDVKDIFGLDGKSVAVIKGFWQNESLEKNLINVRIVETKNIQESMSLVNDGKVDYFIENPTVVKYYIEDSQYYNLVEKGTTSTDSYSYFGVSKDKPGLASIINKVLPMIDIDEMSKKGDDDVPYKDYSKKYYTLNLTIGVLIIFLILVLFCLAKLFNSWVKEKTEKQLLKQRELLLSIDALTEFHNRNYFNTKILKNIDNLNYPQVLIIADLNNLKVINDTYGHQTGDILIKKFAEAIREACPKESQTFRIGGDEFIIILTGSSDAIAMNIIKEINEKTESKTILLDDNNEIIVTAALGYSIRFSNKISFKQLFSEADKNMYCCKRKYKESIETDKSKTE